MPRIRPYEAGDEAGICRLFELVHKRPLPLDVWRWRYAPQPEGVPVTEVAVENGEIVAHLSALPVTLERGPARTRAGLWVDLMVHADYRNLDLFLDLAEASRRRSAEHGVELLFAFPNDKSFHVLKRMLGWQHVCDIRALECPITALTAPRDAGAGWTTRPVELFGSGFDLAWPRLREPGRLCGSRLSARLAWRYRGRPRASYPAWEALGPDGAPGGWLVAKTFDSPRGRIGDLLDLWAAEDGAADALLLAARAHLQTAGAALVSAWAFAGTRAREALRRWGLAPGPDLTHFAGRWTADAGAAFPSDETDWCIAKGDSDIF